MPTSSPGRRLLTALVMLELSICWSARSMRKVVGSFGSSVMSMAVRTTSPRVPGRPATTSNWDSSWYVPSRLSPWGPGGPALTPIDQSTAVA